MWDAGGGLQQMKAAPDIRKVDNREGRAVGIHVHRREGDADDAGEHEARDGGR